MLNEILEQKSVLTNLLNLYLPLNQPVQNINLNLSKEEFNNISKIFIVASGSSRNVGNIAKYFLSDLVEVPVITEYASEFAYKNPKLKDTDLVIAISQSGETADTYSALKVAKEKGSYTLAITNNSESKIHKLAEFKMLVEAGKEEYIAATKSFTAQLMTLFALGFYLRESKGKPLDANFNELKEELHKLPEKLQLIFENKNKIKSIAEEIKSSKSIVLIGRGLNYASAREGALKIKETSYIDANGYPSGEFLHGHMAFIDEEVPLISIITKANNSDVNYNHAINNTKFIVEKMHPKTVIIKNISDESLENISLFNNAMFIDIPSSSEYVSSIYVVISLQLLSYYIAILLDKDLKNPRGLTKAITKE